MRNMLRLKQRAISTERTYLLWLRRFYCFVKGRSPFSLDSSHVKNFLTHQAVDHKVAKSTQDQAFNALLFYYRHVLDKDLDDLTEVVRSRRGRRLPVVLTKSEVAKLLQHLHGVYWLMACIIYGAGLRLSECVKLRIKDIDLETNLITVIGAKGNKDRTTLLAEGGSSLNLSSTRKRLRGSISRIEKTTCPASGYPMLWSENTPMPAKSGSGNGSFLPTTCRWIRERRL
jgi:site-specific recombinase XerD